MQNYVISVVCEYMLQLDTQWCKSALCHARHIPQCAQQSRHLFKLAGLLLFSAISMRQSDRSGLVSRVLDKARLHAKLCDPSFGTISSC